MLLKIRQSRNYAPSTSLVPKIQRVVPQSEPERFEQTDDANFFAFGQQPSEDRVASIKSDADRHRLAMPQRMTRERLELVCRPVPVVERPGRPHLERIAAVGDLMHMERGAAPNRGVDLVRVEHGE